jgi:hypothetical protein
MGTDALMILDIVSADASWDVKSLHVAFDVAPEGHSRLELKTGEIFQSARYASSKKEEAKSIPAKLFVTRQERNAAGQELPSGMRYIKSSGEQGSEIWLIWRLPDDILADFHELILAGRVPIQAILLFPSDALEFGWAPDGSEQKWDNDKTPIVPIENVSFKLDLQAPSIEQRWSTDIPDDNDRAFFSDTARVNFALLRKLSAIEGSMRGLTGTVGFIAVLVLVLVLRRFGFL